MKQAVNKTQAVLDYLKDHPTAMSKGIVAALRRQGIEISSNQAARIKMTTDAALNATALQEKLTLEQIKMIAQAIKRIRSRKVALRENHPIASLNTPYACDETENGNPSGSA